MRNTEVTVAEARLSKMEPESGWGVPFSKLSYSHNPNNIWEQQHPWTNFVRTLSKCGSA